MLKKPFGQSGQDASILGFGCMRLPLTDPNNPQSIDRDLATEMIRKAIDRGVNYVDTAWPYHGVDRVAPGQSELAVAEALQKGYRQKVLLASKLPTWAVTESCQMNYYLDEQLKRLDTPYIDCYLAHNLNGIVWPGIRDLGLFKFLDEALKDGRIKQAGFSFHDRYPLFDEIIQSYDWSFAQIQYNYLDINYQAGRKGLKQAYERGLGVVIMEPLRGGFLIDHMPHELKEMLAQVRPQWSLADWGLRWLWNENEVGVVLSGMSTMAQVDENLDIADNFSTLNDEDQKAIDRVRQFFEERLKVNCTSCGYCLPCPEGVNIPKIFSFYNNYFLADAEVVRARTKYFFNSQVAAHESYHQCVHCGQCEDKCPQKLPISETMDEVAKVFD